MQRAHRRRCRVPRRYARRPPGPRCVAAGYARSCRAHRVRARGTVSAPGWSCRNRCHRPGSPPGVYRSPREYARAAARPAIPPGNSGPAAASRDGARAPPRISRFLPAAAPAPGRAPGRVAADHAAGATGAAAHRVRRSSPARCVLRVRDWRVRIACPASVHRACGFMRHATRGAGFFPHSIWAARRGTRTDAASCSRSDSRGNNHSATARSGSGYAGPRRP